MKNQITLKIIPLILLLFACSAVNIYSQLNKSKKAEGLEALENLIRQQVYNQQKTKSENIGVVKGLSSSDKYERNLFKINGSADRKSFFMNGNNINVEVFNYGGIAPGLGGIREVTNLVWNDLPYIFQFDPIVGASVPHAENNNQRIHIISDALNDYDGLREESPTGEKWVWQPLPGYADPNQDEMASNPAVDQDHDGKPDSWPRNWYNETLGEYVWPGLLTQGENNADLETFWVMDDRDNSEFKYYPFINDTTRRGLGLQIEGRAFQWSNSLAANAIFFVYSITNVSDKDLDSVFFGIYGDPDVGGVDNDDDNGFFVPPYSTPEVDVENIPVYARSMVYFWDPDGTGDRGLPVGYLGCKFLESPGNSDDGIDNDGDGMIDERQDDGIDNDGDWNVETDDVGVDGIPNTGDDGEADGIPTRGKRLPDGSSDPLFPGEPNFEFTDLDESDQIGLTSFNSWTWNEDKISNDESMWQRSIPGNFGEIQQNTDIVFVFGSGYISLKKGETKRISMAFLFGEDLNDLLTNAETVQDIYNKNYRFFKPPSLPKVSAVPGDEKVTLYWDTSSEESVDPITGKDFEGYVIYRSTDPGFNDIKTVTDGRGAAFLYEPLKDIDGFEAKWDLNNEWIGYHPVPYQNRGINYYVGDNTGLVHSFVDSNKVINGQTYYYSVVAYDHGDSLGIPPSETTKKISVDPITSELRFDDNTVQVIPGPRTSGYSPPVLEEADIVHDGIGNGKVEFQIVDDLKIIDNEYKLKFSSVLNQDGKEIKAKNYTVEDLNVIEEEFYLFDLKYTSLGNTNLIDDINLIVKGENGQVYSAGTDYELELAAGKIKRTENSSMPNNGKFIITYRYYPVYQSTALNLEDSNPVFDGVNVLVQDYTELAVDEEKSGWTGSVDIDYSVKISTVGSPSRKKLYPADYDLTFSNSNEFTALKVASGKLIEIPVNFKVEDVTSGVPQQIKVLLNEKAVNDEAWSRGDEIILFQPGAEGALTDTLTWGITVAASTPGDSIQPSPGDVLHIITQRPFNSLDVFTFSTKAGYVDNETAKNGLENIYVVPNPYIAANDLEPANRLSSQSRGERRIYFENLPQVCTIRIFTLSGELVAQLEHSESYENGREFWNLLNKDGFGVAYGLYIAHIDAPGIGEKLVKFALIK